MKIRRSILILVFLIPSLVLSQKPYPHTLSEAELSNVQPSEPGAIPQLSTQVDPVVQGIIRQVNLDSLVASVRILSGEDSVVLGGEVMWIRNRTRKGGGDRCADYLKQRLASYNLEVCDQIYSFTGRNIYAKQTGYLFPERQYIICAHYDAWTEWYDADDNASGMAAVMEAARILSQYSPKYTVVYAFWDDEQIGCIGSQYYLSQASSSQLQIQGVLNMDMIGWDGNNDYLADIHTQDSANSNDLASLLVNLNSLYELPLKPAIHNPGTWQSDQSVFWNHGFGAILLMEAYTGGDLNPYYHTPEDRIDRFNLPYFHSMSKLSLATLATLLEVTDGPLIASVVPAEGYQRHAAHIQIKGVNTHFQENPSSTRVWLSKQSETLDPDSVRINDNTTLHAYFNIPLTAARGSWSVNVQTATDSVLTKPGGFSVLPPPANITISPESLSVTLAVGETKECLLTISNIGAADLRFTVSKFGPNYAVHFDGVDDMVVGPAAGFPAGNDDKTIELWFKKTGQPSEEGPLVEYGAQGIHRGIYGLAVNESNFLSPRWFFHQWGGGKWANTTIESNQWYHVAAVAVGNDTAIIYTNGEVDGGGWLSYCTVAGTSYYMGKALADNGDDRTFNGFIDEVRVWNYARTQSEIQSDMNRELTGTEPGLVGYWQFNDSSGARASDLSGNANHGSLVGGPSWAISSAPIAPLWFRVKPDSGVCLPQSSMDICVSFDATRLDAGNYHASFRISTNDPFNPAVTIPVTIPIYMRVSTAVGVADHIDIPSVFTLSQNYPNPFNPSTTIRYGLPHASDVTLAVFNTLGQQVAELVKERKEAGYHEVKFDDGRLPSGVYFYRLQAGNYVDTKKLVLTK